MKYFTNSVTATLTFTDTDTHTVPYTHTSSNFVQCKYHRGPNLREKPENWREPNKLLVPITRGTTVNGAGVLHQASGPTVQAIDDWKAELTLTLYHKAIKRKTMIRSEEFGQPRHDHGEGTLHLYAFDLWDRSDPRHRVSSERCGGFFGSLFSKFRQIQTQLPTFKKFTYAGHGG
jgi:hypothetical protein